jgi:hypothetical protein
MKYYYLIETTDNERGSSYKEICETLEEAESKVMNYADWYCSNGTCRIVAVNNKMCRVESLMYSKGELVEHRIKLNPKDDRTWSTVFKK